MSSWQVGQRHTCAGTCHPTAGLGPADGKSTTYALGLLAPRGVLFLNPQQEVYTGMLVGEHSRDNDLEVQCLPLYGVTTSAAFAVPSRSCWSVA